MEPADRDALLAAVDWSPLKVLKPGEPVLRPEEFDYDPQVRAFRFDLEGERMVWRVLEAADQRLPYFAESEPPDAERLILWLDNQCRALDIGRADMVEFCRRAVQGLLDAGTCDVSLLVSGRKVLAEAIRGKLDALRGQARKLGFQQLLFGPTAKVETSFDEPWRFPTGDYTEGVPPYAGGYRFQKHYYDEPRDLKSSGEEFRCAQSIDNHPAVEVWLRNVPKQHGSFKLPTSSDNFYPDFVARLKDGRVLLIEYKGGDRLSNDDTREKVAIGKLWEEKSGGRGAFLLVSEAEADYRFDRRLAPYLQRPGAA